MKRSYSLKIGLAILILPLFVQTTAYSAIIRVKPDGNDANTGESWALAKKTVGGAIAAANQGDEIWVAAGTYPEHIQNRVVNDVAVDVALFAGFVYLVSGEPGMILTMMCRCRGITMEMERQTSRFGVNQLAIGTSSVPRMGAS